MPFTLQSLQLPNVLFHPVARPPGAQARCLPLRELSLRVLASEGPGCWSLGVERCSPRCVPYPLSLIHI